MQKISELFEVNYGHSLELNRLTQDNSDSAINFVGRAARNNGVTARVLPIPIAPAPAGSITVALNGQGGAGVAFLQPKPFYTGYHVMVLSPKFEMSEQEKLWWAYCITANRFRFGFGRQANRTLKDLILPPIDAIPDWVSNSDLNRYNGADRSSHLDPVPEISTITWRKFALNDLFDIRKGARLTKADMRTGSTPYVGAVDSRNGVTRYIANNPIHDGGTISVNYNGSVAEAFYQPIPFWAGDDVNVLYPRGFDINERVGLFYAPSFAWKNIDLTMEGSGTSKECEIPL